MNSPNEVTKQARPSAISADTQLMSAVSDTDDKAVALPISIDSTDSSVVSVDRFVIMLDKG